VDDDGNTVPFGFRKGDRVLVHKDGGTEIKLDGKTYRILGSDVLAVVD
jgi:chaperonin GroES